MRAERCHLAATGSSGSVGHVEENRNPPRTSLECFAHAAAGHRCCSNRLYPFLRLRHNPTGEDRDCAGVTMVWHMRSSSIPEIDSPDRTKRSAPTPPRPSLLSSRLRARSSPRVRSRPFGDAAASMTAVDPRHHAQDPDRNSLDRIWFMIYYAVDFDSSVVEYSVYLIYLLLLQIHNWATNSCLDTSCADSRHSEPK